MQRYKDFTAYTPTDSAYAKLIEMGVEFLKDSSDNDWYAVQSTFESATYKLIIASDNAVIGYDTDVTKLWPPNCSVFEFESLPDGFTIPGYVYDESTDAIVEKTYTTEELDTIAQAKIKTLLSSAQTSMLPYQSAVDLGIATDLETAILKAWKTYTVELNRVTSESSYPTSITWPDVPTEDSVSASLSS